MRYTAGKELTPEYLAERKARIQAAAERPYIYDPDCPPLTEKQLSEFRPVNFASMEERAIYMESQMVAADMVVADIAITETPYAKP
jgi:hypothetical protein